MTSGDESASMDESALALLRESVALWSEDGSVERPQPSTFIVTASSLTLRIERAATGLPFRWMVTNDARQRGASSIVGVLRHLRAALEPDYAGHRVRVMAATLPP